MPPFLLLFTIILALSAYATNVAIDRRSLVARYNPVRTASSTSTPIQVGNGNFAFGTDITGLQTFQPFAIMSSWGWKNDTFPPGRTLEDILTYKGVSLDNHGRNVTYMYGGVDDIQQWLISNPNRVNLGRVGLLFLDASGRVQNVTEADLESKMQKLDLWTGIIRSSFTLDGASINVTAVSSQDSDTIGVKVDSRLIGEGRLGLFLDFPWNDGSQKFSAPFVGFFNMTANHTTQLTSTKDETTKNTQAEIRHTLVNNSFVTTIGGSSFNITRDSPDAHRYLLRFPSDRQNFTVSLSYALQKPPSLPDFQSIQESSQNAWNSYWSDTGFVDVYTHSTDARANELQRRIILSQYHLRVNEAGDYPPQEVGIIICALP